MGKIIAIDFGLKRTGLAITDDSNIFAFGLDTVESKDLMGRLKELIQKENVSTVVIGLPKRLNDKDTHITQNVYLLKEAIEKELKSIKVDLVDERFTSKMASEAMHFAGATRKQKKQKELVDKVSATIILQSYLNQGGNV
ncbi:MAG: Holliday junction resolvase RuvX [Crocinitomicaceae bacterium]|nr:Holliday junction resolvase RuvX [Crocinitomicaceae bacterium]